MSDRMINNANKSYISDFSIHDKDLNFIIQNIIINNFTSPLIGIGHSMGGHILLSSQELMKDSFKAIILSAPMLGFKNENLLFLLIYIMNLFGKGEKYFPGSNLIWVKKHHLNKMILQVILIGTKGLKD